MFSISLRVYNIHCPDGEYMDFEWDPKKSETNKQKHGIDFECAKKLWNDPVLISKAKEKNEPRMLVVGKIGNIFWTAIATQRQLKIRIISVRRSRNEEKKAYQKKL
jgi:uncharacterized protein